MKHLYERAPKIIISAALVLIALLLNCKATECVIRSCTAWGHGHDLTVHAKPSLGDTVLRTAVRGQNLSPHCLIGQFSSLHQEMTENKDPLGRASCYPCSRTS